MYNFTTNVRTKRNLAITAAAVSRIETLSEAARNHLSLAWQTHVILLLQCSHDVLEGTQFPGIYQIELPNEETEMLKGSIQMCYCT